MLPKGQSPESLFRFKQLVMSPCKIKIKRLFTYKIQWCRMSILFPEGRGTNVRITKPILCGSKSSVKSYSPDLSSHECGAVV